MTRIRVRLSVLGVVLLGLLLAASVAAQSPAASPAASAAAPAISAQFLGGGEPAIAPAYELTLRRITLPPGTGIVPHTHPGALVIYIESGIWNYTSLSGTGRVTRATQPGASPAPAEDLAVNVELVLTAGDVLYVEDPGDTVSNMGDEDVVLLVAGLTRVGEKFTTLIQDPPMASPSPAS